MRSLQLLEMNAALVHLLPSVFGFVVLRWPAWTAVARLVRVCAPRRVLDGVEEARDMLLCAGAMGVLALALHTPPTLMCAPYDPQRVQGACGLLGLLCLALSNRLLASSLALSALMGVAHASFAALPLSGLAVAAAASVPYRIVLYVIVLLYTLTHAIYCHSEQNPERTYGAVLGAVTLGTLGMYYGLALSLWLCCGCLGAPFSLFPLISRSTWRRTYRTGRGGPPAAAAAAAAPSAASRAAPPRPLPASCRATPAATPPPAALAACWVQYGSQGVETNRRDCA